MADNKSNIEPEEKSGNKSEENFPWKSLNELLNNKLLEELARNYPVITNLAFVTLLGLSGIQFIPAWKNLLNSVSHNQNIDSPNNIVLPSVKATACNDFKERFREYLDDSNSLGSEVVVLGNDDNRGDKKESRNSKGESLVFSCTYGIKDSSGKVEQISKSIQVKLHPQLLDLTRNNSYDEVPILPQDLEKACRDQVRLKIEGETQVLGVELAEKKRDVWPVFRWVCKFRSLENKKGDIFTRTPREIGLDLDKFCKETYQNKEKATHYSYDDPYSLFCTRPGSPN